jgi:hypothetical protein
MTKERSISATTRERPTKKGLAPLLIFSVTTYPTTKKQRPEAREIMICRSAMPIS